MSSAGATFDKGDRVEIVRGRQGVGVAGRVFWEGPNKYGPGERLGVRGDDGQTCWVASGDVAAAAAGQPEPAPARSFERGDRVAFTRDGARLVGEVFWTGQSGNGPGQRLGLRVEGEEEPAWIDARLVRPDDGPSRPAAPSGREPEEDPGDELPADRAAAVGMHELPPAPPIDDAYIDACDWEPEEGAG